jgi:hypothetical protein
MKVIIVNAIVIRVDDEKNFRSAIAVKAVRSNKSTEARKVMPIERRKIIAGPMCPCASPGASVLFWPRFHWT